MALIALLAGPSIAAAQPQADGRYLPDGAEVLDQVTGLIWQRCALGRTWSGTTCEGVTANFSHAAALQAAQQAAAGGIAWRLPNVKELHSLVLRDRFPTFDEITFPSDGLADYSDYWSSTRYLGNGSSSNQACAVDLSYGIQTGPYRTDQRPVRLVRTAP